MIDYTKLLTQNVCLIFKYQDMNLIFISDI